VIHPQGCKTCLNGFYSELLDSYYYRWSNSHPGKKSKTLRRNPLIATAPIPLYLDKTKRLIQERIVDLQDQILIFKENEVVRFGILDYQQVFQELVQK
jgi:hypothetical protein